MCHLANDIVFCRPIENSRGMKLLIRRDFLLFCFVWGAGKEVVNSGPEWNNRTLWQGRNESKEKTTLVFLLSPPFFSNYIGGWSGVFSLNCMAVTFYIFPSRMILADCMASKYASGRFFLAAGKEENYQQPLQQGLYNFPAGLGFGFVVKSRAPPLRTPDNRRNSSYI